MTKPISLPVDKQSLAQKRQAVKRLPAPVPGQVISIPLDLWTLYMELHRIEPVVEKHWPLLVKRIEKVE